MTGAGPTTILSVSVKYEHDVVAARQRARQIAGMLGFDAQDQTRIATAVSEIARNAYTYAGGGRVEFAVEGRTAPQVFTVQVTDRGPGIADLARILGGAYRSTTGMGLGIIGARRLMDHFQIESGPGKGTTVQLKKLVPRSAPVLDSGALAALVAALARQRPQTALDEIQQQNQELLQTLDALRARQEELTQLNRELEDTNRGVVALYAELDEKADHLRRADEMKTRFLSNMSHEFRTPLNSILALSRLLQQGTDGSLTPEQEKQVAFIRKAAEGLTELVNDLLDLAKVEAGKIVIRPIEFEVANLFGALRGMLRPMLVNESVALVFDDAPGLPPIFNDEAKISQILRNFISNALKFTERGEVRVAATLTPQGDAVAFSVTDTGIGIAPEDQERIFQEFGQVEHALQRKVKGTGLGLPLTRKLAHLLGGRVTLTSTLGQGSTFTAVIPLRYVDTQAAPPAVARVEAGSSDGLPVLIVENNPQDAMIYAKFLRDCRFSPVPVTTLREAREVLKHLRPVAIVLDILLRGEESWAFLAELKREPATSDIAVVVVTTVDDPRKGYGLGADAYAVKPIERLWLLETLNRLVTRGLGPRVLAIDDDEATHYLLRSMLADGPYQMLAARDGEDGLRAAREDNPAAIVLDLGLPKIDGFEVLERLKASSATHEIPVIVLTSKALERDDHERLAGATAVLSKSTATRDVVRTALDMALAAGTQETRHA
jgi:signal transduction histidine kinase/DNA-binding response OmpR family regulator